MKLFFRIAILSFVFISTCCGVLASDSTKVKKCKIILTSGKELVGEIIREDSAEIILKNEVVETKIPRIRIRHITLISADDESIVKKQKVGKAEFVIGATLSIYVPYNVRFGMRDTTRGMAFHVSGGYKNSLYSVQLSAMFAFAKDKNICHYLSVMLGVRYADDPGLSVTDSSFSQGKTSSGVYYGLGYAINFHGFFAEAGGGLVYGTGLRLPHLLFQIGYVN